MSRDLKAESSRTSKTTDSGKNSKSEKFLHAFGKISDFVSELNGVFGGHFHEIAAYNHLLSRTKISQKLIIKKHVELFREFCERNREAFLSKDFSKIVSRRIAFSERAYIDVHALLSQKNIDSDTSDTIWNHLLVISASIDPTVEIQEMLKKLQTSGSPEGQFLDNFFTRIQSVDTSNISASDPMTAASAILQSGVLNDLVGSIDKQVKDGSLDFGKLLGTVQTMLGSFSGMPGGPSNDANPLAGMGGFGNMLNMMMSGGMGEMLTQASNSSGSNGSTTKQSEVDKMKDSIEAKIEAQVQLELSRLPRPTETPSVPQIQVLDDSKSERKIDSAD